MLHEKDKIGCVSVLLSGAKVQRMRLGKVYIQKRVWGVRQLF